MDVTIPRFFGASSDAAGSIPKARTGIRGLDEVTGGGLPAGRSTLVTGAAGSGKTLLGVEFLVYGALHEGEPGVLLAFEESADDLAANVMSLGIDLRQLQSDGRLVIDAFRVDPAETIETGAYDLEGLFIRLAYAVESIGAKRIVLDTIEAWSGAIWRIGRRAVGLLLTASSTGAAGARATGLADAIVPSGTNPLEWVRTWMGGRSELALDSAASLIRLRGGDPLERAEFARMFATGEPQLGLAAFLEKKKPNWTDRT